MRFEAYFAGRWDDRADGFHAPQFKSSVKSLQRAPKIKDKELFAIKSWPLLFLLIFTLASIRDASSVERHVLTHVSRIGVSELGLAHVIPISGVCHITKAVNTVRKIICNNNGVPGYLSYSIETICIDRGKDPS